MTTPYASEAYLHQLLGKALSAQASDVHLKVGQPPGARVRGDMVYFRAEKVIADDTDAVARILLGAKDRLEGLLDRTTTYDAGTLGRFRVTIYRQQGALSLVMRAIPAKVPTLEELGLPPSVAAMVEQGRGLLVVAGGARQGKSTTLAAMVGHLNAGFPRHVITIEDPIEFLHEGARSSVSQREVGADAPSFAAALRTAHWQDPDVVLVSTLDSADALDAALSLVEAGRLVLTALPVLDGPRAVARLFRVAREGAALVDAERIVDGLAGIITQRLSPKQDGSGLGVQADVLVVTPAVRDALRQPAPTAALEELLAKGRGAAT